VHVLAVANLPCRACGEKGCPARHSNAVPSSRGDGDEIDAVAEFLFVPPEWPLVMSCRNWLFPWPTAQQPLTIEVVSERGGCPLPVAEMDRYVNCCIRSRFPHSFRDESGLVDRQGLERLQFSPSWKLPCSASGCYRVCMVLVLGVT
jgi:hypothetical protein